MPDVDDIALLREYVDRNSESAFAEIVLRRVNLVFSVALRFTGDSEDAQDVTQTVFIILAKKAAGLRSKTILTGWLYETTRFAAMNFLTRKNRRQTREQEAYMQSAIDQSEDKQLWQQLAPHLEEAMSRLRAADRELLAMRFYENKTGEEAAALLGIGVAAAHKRTNRALEKLQRFFASRGVTSTTDAIAGAVSVNSMSVAPVALAKSVTAVALAKGAAVSTSTLTLINGALKIMAWTKAKTAVVIGVVVLFTAGTATVVVEKVAHANSLSQRLPDGSMLTLDKVSFKLSVTRCIWRPIGCAVRHHRQKCREQSARKAAFLQAVQVRHSRRNGD